jgi:energy-coupling factor transport system substrate-specific component
MSWELVTLAVLGVAIAAGFAWYERSRPAANVLAVVAALAALAVIGRIAFAAFPNVKPTTDIVLIAGYGLGGPPGFAVGAVTALASNFFLSQGPWTPWQMVGWGGVGIFGALLARVMRGREPSRLMLAIACAVAGAGFGILMDFYQWTLAAEQSFASYLAIAGTSLPYNLAHVIGNFVFALLIGKPLVNTLRRIRSRFDARWEPRRAALPATLLVAALGAALLVPSLAVSQKDDTSPLTGDAGSDALTWLRAAQNDDGGFGSDDGKKSNQLYSGWAALALAAGGSNPASTTNGGDTLLEYIEDDLNKLDDTTDLARTIMVVEASGLKADKFSGDNLVKDMTRDRNGDGSYNGGVAVTAFAMLAQKAAGEKSGLTASARYLIDRQNEDDGGWALNASGDSDVDITASVLQALEAANSMPDDTEDAALDFLKKAQNGDGGFGQTDGDSSNSQSTAFAIQGLQAIGETPADFGGKNDPIKYLEDQQLKDGSIKYGGGSKQTPVWVTAQAILGLKTADFPLSELTRPYNVDASGKEKKVKRSTSGGKHDQNNDIIESDSDPQKIKSPGSGISSSSPTVPDSSVTDLGNSSKPPKLPKPPKTDDTSTDVPVIDTPAVVPPAITFGAIIANPKPPSALGEAASAAADAAAATAAVGAGAGQSLPPSSPSVPEASPPTIEPVQPSPQNGSSPDGGPSASTGAGDPVLTGAAAAASSAASAVSTGT